jgi:DNA repair protein RadC
MASPKVRDVSMQKRDRLLDYGVSSMSGAELLSILTGLPEVQTSQLLGGLGDLDANTKAGLQQITQEELQYHWKFSDAKTAVLLAALELGRRVFLPSLNKGAIMDCPENVAAAFPELHIATVEHFGVLLLDIKNRMIAKRITTVGTVDETIAHPREVFRDAIKVGAAGIIVVHNHPSGQTSPSSEDLRLTEQLLSCSRTHQIPLHDHVVIGHGEFTSIRRTTSLWNTYSKAAEH